MSAQHEIVKPGPLLNARGEIAEPGYARRPLLAYDPRAVRVSALPWANRLRLKEWDYYGTITDRYFFASAVSHGGVAGVVFAYLIDFAAGTMASRTALTPLGRGCRMPASSEGGDVRFEKGGVEIAYLHGGRRREARVRWPRFSRGEALEARLTAYEPERAHAIVMATPMGGGRFYYNHKISAMETEGEVRLGGLRYEARRADAFTTLDWGRGVWPYRTFWNWATASGRLPDGRAVSLNLGKGFGDLSAATENALWVDGAMTKYGWVEFRYDPADFHKPWRFESEDGRLRLAMTPIFERPDAIDLVVLRTESHQMFGAYAGEAVTDSGETLRLEGVMGWAEEHRARW